VGCWWLGFVSIRMPGTDGIEATRQVIEAGTAQVIVLITFDMDEYVYGALRAGAAGLAKDAGLVH
jgi:DNA-binding NarL/FixJ family response regulator